MDLTEKLKSAISAQDERELSRMYNTEYWYKNITWDDSFVDFVDIEVEKNNICAINLKGFMYQKGLIFDQDYQEAMKWYSKASDQGHALAKYNIGYIYDTGLGVVKDYKEAMKWYLEASKLGSSEAIFAIGYFYDYGTGVDLDYAKAMKWYLKASELGDGASNHNIGFMYYFGHGVDQNYKEAMKWFLRALASDPPCLDSKDLVKSILAYHPDEMISFFCKTMETAESLKRKVSELEQENLELKLRPPPEGGELYVEAKNRFKKRKK
jgi:TPR repeat protein